VTEQLNQKIRWEKFMQSYDFRNVVPGSPLPLWENDFVFYVQGVAFAEVKPPRGISCGPAAKLELTDPVNSLELEVLNGAAATITALFKGPNGVWTVGVNGSRPLTSNPSVQTIRFDFYRIQRITFEGTELYLNIMRY
jgi:hypothetical protein